MKRLLHARTRLAALRRAVFALALALAAFPAIRWLVATDQVAEPAVYTLGVVAVTALSLVPALIHWPFSSIALPLALVYVVFRFLIAGEVLSSSILVVETLSLIGLSWLVHRLFAVVGSFEATHGAAADPSFGSLLDLEDLQLDTARQQFMLACRHQRPLSCIVVEPIPDALDVQLGEVGPRISRSFLEDYALDWSAKIAAETARRSDLTIRGEEPRRLFLLCPETDRESAIRVAQKIARAMAERLGIGARLGVATYPEQVLSLEDLVRRAASELEEPEKLGDSGQLLIEFAETESESAAPGLAPDAVTEGVGNAARPAAGVVSLGSGLARPTLSERVGWLSKRTFDLLLVSLFAPIWLPVVGLIALAVKLDSPRGPVFFAQSRVGRGGRRFRMFKFRTMVPAAEELKRELRQQSEMEWPDFKIKEDPRITRVGHFLRRTSLDELPQLLNVLRGEMSLVGPRPTSFSDDTYALWQKARLAVPPGLTGLWQITSRGSADFEQRARLDISYIERRSLFLDVWILFRTAGVVLSRKGGY